MTSHAAFDRGGIRGSEWAVGVGMAWRGADIEGLYFKKYTLPKKFAPTIHSVPTSFFPTNQEFSKALGRSGMYRNYSLNTGLDPTPY
ncbi:hypothetical protein NQ318_015708 [Aromia moschata]|uniref:Uncharacterized protein n=1 Tax=Aromia moschata TaxID=1265417 RepID=A0AAV8YFX9_9CUCU|nr:hypothetical protein NQ318_015708 [Aromia moschata]